MQTKPIEKNKGKFCWQYEMSLFKNPTIFLTTAKALLIALAITVLLIGLISCIADGFSADSLRFVGELALIMFGIFAVLLVLGYLLYAAIMGGVYIVDFEMDEKTIVHAQCAKQSKKAEAIGFPLIAKPANLGSSIGIETIKSADEFREKISECLNYDFKVVVERMIEELKEVNISVIGSDSKAKVSPIEEVTNGVLTYDKKYMPNGSKGGKTGSKAPSKTSASKGMASTIRKVPAELEEGQKEEIEKIALKAFRALNSFGCVRIDFMIDRKDGSVYCNEINTIPGSLAFYLWDHDGMSFTEECDELISNALNRYARRSRKTYSFDTNILDNYAKK